MAPSNGLFWLFQRKIEKKITGMTVLSQTHFRNSLSYCSLNHETFWEGVLSSQRGLRFGFLRLWRFVFAGALSEVVGLPTPLRSLRFIQQVSPRVCAFLSVSLKRCRYRYCVCERDQTDAMCPFCCIPPPPSNVALQTVFFLFDHLT